MKTKRILALLLAVLMVLALGAPVFAEEGDTEGTTVTSLTIDDALKGNSYAVYKIFTLESYDKANNHYSYTIEKSNPLYETVQNMNIDGSVFTLADKDDEISYVKLAKNTTNNSALMRNIASKLMAAITEKGIAPVQQVNYLGMDGKQELLPAGADITVTPVAGKEDRYDITFSGLGEGYFLVDTSAGTMFALNTTDPEVTITAKNKLPSIEKYVRRNSDGQWAKDNSKCIGEKVEFRVEVKVEDGATNYKLYDIISDGLTFGAITKVYYAKDEAQAKYTVYDAASTDKTNMTPYFAYDNSGVAHEGKATCFQITFTDKFLSDVLTNPDRGGDSGLNTKIYVEYYATVNAQAVIAEEFNPNEIHMTYGSNDVEVTKSMTKTYVYEAELVKTDDKNELLSDAKFELYKRSNGETLSEQIKFVKIEGTEGEKTVYRVAVEGETGTVTEIEAGDVIIRGLGGNFGDGDPRNYYLKETNAPLGYNLLDSEETIRIKDANLMATVDGTKYVEGGVHVINETGTKLPSTGGIGTTIFYVLGGLLVAAAVVLLITRKRVGADQDAQI